MIPDCKTYNFTATSRNTNKTVKGIVMAPTKFLAKLNVIDLSGFTLCDVKIGGVRRVLSEKEKNSRFLVNGA